jgi:hypothetical protein
MMRLLEKIAKLKKMYEEVKENHRAMKWRDVKWPPIPALKAIIK